MGNFLKKWNKIREEKKSNICAGLDPAVYEMDRGEKGLIKGKDKLKWSLDFIEAVAPYVSVIKPNIGYWIGVGDLKSLEKIIEKIKEKKLVSIADSKIADLGSTGDAWIYSYKKMGFDAVTIAPFAGNVEELIESGKKYDIAIITMGLMSNPEYKSEMNFVNNKGEKLWENRVKRAICSGVDGLVAGGTFTKESDDFRNFIRITNDSDVIYLVPGIGFQGGKIEEFLETGIDCKKCIISSSREIMFPKGSNSTSDMQAHAAMSFRDEFNKLI